MIVQWCCKGLAKVGEAEILEMFSNHVGLICQDWFRSWKTGESFVVKDAMERLSEAGLHRHVNDFSSPDPASGLPFCEVTPFISLSAGCVDRDVQSKTNQVHRALRTALDFATTDYADPARPPCHGWVLYCYVVLGSNPAVRVPIVAEEVRELNHNRAFSGWYWQGEVAAKLNVPSAQILCAERYEPRPGWSPRVTKVLVNPGFYHPAALLAERRML
jgi:hypothetical protein